MTSVPLITIYDPDDILKPTKPSKPEAPKESQPPQEKKMEIEKQISDKIPLPGVFQVPVRNDIVHQVFSNIAKNIRQAHGVDPNAGMKHSGESWGTGRAVSRIPRVSGSGTHRSGQGAFANCVRKGRMFAPLKVWRRWQKRHAAACAIAATGYSALVMARGHKIDHVPEIPFVVEDKIENYDKTKEAVNFLKRVGAYEDVEKVILTKHIRAGKGKLRNKRYKIRKGPLVIYYNKAAKLVKAFRNIPGVETCNVYALNLKQLAPGGQLGRFVIWTKSAFKALNEIFGRNPNIESQVKGDYSLLRPLLTNADVARIINSSEIQNAIRAPERNKAKHMIQKKNPLKNRKFMDTLNPEASATRKSIAIANEERRKKRLEDIANKRGITKSLTKEELVKKKERKKKSNKWINEVTNQLYDVAQKDMEKYKEVEEVEEAEEGEEDEEK